MSTDVKREKRLWIEDLYSLLILKFLMKKQIIVSLLILNSVSAYAMEDTSSFFSLSSLGSYFFTSSLSFQTPNESELVINLRADKDKFEEQLKLDKKAEIQKTYILPVTLQLFSKRGVEPKPTRFLQYCYYQKFHKNEMENLQTLQDDFALFKVCLDVQIDGYSALSAAMLAPDIPLYARYNFVQQLINLDFCSTPKDREIAELILYDEIMKNKQNSEFKKKLIHLLHPDSPAYWCILPHDVRKLIAQYLVEVIKTDNNYWLLPDGKKDLVVMY